VGRIFGWILGSQIRWDKAPPPSVAATAHNLIDTTNHPVTGLTAGHFLKATGATTYAFGAHDLTAADVGAAAAGYLATGWMTADALTFASADAPTYTVTVAGDQTAKYTPGMRMKCDQTQTPGYFIITKVTYSAGTGLTTLTLYGGTDYTLDADPAITSPAYSHVKAPVGFPLDPLKWTVLVTDTKDRSKATPTANNWYEFTSNPTITVPIGLWELSYQVNYLVYRSATTASFIYGSVALSNGVPSPTTDPPTDLDMIALIGGSDGTSHAGDQIGALCHRSKTKNLSTKTTYNLICMTPSANVAVLGAQNASGTMVLKAECKYL
jgi:hypothetical protein